MKSVEYRIDSYMIEIYSSDLKGAICMQMCWISCETRSRYA